MIIYAEVDGMQIDLMDGLLRCLVWTA